MRPDPTAAPTRADRAYDEAQWARQLYYRRLDELSEAAADCADARFEGQYSDGYSLAWLKQAYREMLMDVFPIPRSPEDAADDEAMEYGENLRERD